VLRRFGLRARISALFSLGAFVLSSGIAVAAYDLTRHSVLQERERTAVRAAFFDEAVAQQGLTGENPDVVEALRSLDTGQARRPLVHREGKWFSRTADDGLVSAIPAKLLHTVGGGTPAVQRIEVAGQPAVVVGIPLPRGGGEFYEVHSLTEARRTLRTLGAALLGAALAATFGAAALGRWASRRLLAPVSDVGAAAQRISGGDLTTRLEISDPDLRPVAESFNAMVQELSDRIAKDQRFAADVSHELRSPLQTLTAAADVLAARADRLDPRSAAASRLVAEEAERFGLLVQDLLELARDDRPARLQTVPVAPLLERLCRNRGLPLDVLAVSEEIGCWSLEPRRIERILDNLIDNADKYGGGVVRLAAEVRDDELVITVDDDGPGIPPEERAVVFDRFARGRTASARGAAQGTGLGLSIAARHAAAHGGTLGVSDHDGRGARFTVTLPRGDEAS
jgi:signal transduction histidine kinase